MGVESRKAKAPPLPAPTETSTADSADENENDNAELESGVTEKSTYSLPEDGSPVTIATRKKKHHGKESRSELASNNKSQTSLLIEYFEGGKEDKSRRPSVRVKVTPSSKHRSKSAHDHIQITERKGNRRPSYTQRIPLSPHFQENRPPAPEDENSMSSFRSTTEESNVTSRSGRPVEVEIMRHGSPLIPTDLGSKTMYNASEISSMPADSFLDGHTRSPERKRSRSLTRGEALVAGAATGLAAGAAADKLRTPSRRRSRSLSRERIVAQKAVEKVRGDRSERRRKHRSRSRSVSGEKLGEALKSPRRRSSRSHHDDSMLSGADSVHTTSQVSRNSDKYSYRSGTSKSSINNPKLLETVEDAIRRLILPELKSLKRESSKRSERRASVGSGLSRDSREDFLGPKVTLNDGEVLSGNSMKRRKDEHLNSSRSFERDGSEETVIQDERVHKKRSGEKHRGLEAAAVGAGVGALTAAALEKHQSQEPIDEKKERRRRRKNHSRGNSLGGELREDRLEVTPPMPLMSDINASDITRTSILSAETERPQSAHSASQERITSPLIREVSRGVGSPSSRTPTRTPVNLQHGLGTQHSNFSRGNLSLNSQNSDQRLRSQEYDLDEHGRKVPMQDHYDPDLDDSFVSEEHNAGHSNAAKAGLAGAAAGAGLAAMHHDDDDSELLEEDLHHPYYQNTQEVPPPLRYIPYGHERRGLSPIQSVSGYTENEDQQLENKRDSRLTQSTASYSSLNKSTQHKQSSKSLDSIGNVHNRHDFTEVRQGGLTDSEITQDNDGDFWEEQHRENDRDRDLDSEGDDSRLENKRNYTDESLDTRVVSTGQDIKGVGANPKFVNTPIGVESAVASLLNASDLTGTNSYPGNSQYDRRASYASYEDESENNFTSRGNSPTKSPTKYEEEYDIDENGRKVAMPKSQTKEKLEGAALGATAAALLARAREKMNNNNSEYGERLQGAPLEKSFKERAMNGQRVSSPSHSIDELSDISHEPKMTATGIPDLDDPMPEIGYGDGDSDVTTNPSIIQGPIGGTQQGSRDHWPNQATPPSGNRSAEAALKEAAEAGLVGAAAGAAAGHNSEGSQDQDDEWRRTSSERKRDTLITNPYEDTSPIAAIGNGSGLDRELLNQAGFQNASHQYNSKLYQTGSPGALPKDEGYISSAPNARSIGAQTPDQRKGKGIDFLDKELGNAADALGGDLYPSKHSRHLSGMSQGMDSPLYDSATGNGIDRIQSKDIVALMDHLTVRDAQRSARDTEILVTLVRTAAEMRNSYEDFKRLLADTEDVIITEVQANTEKSVQKVINGPRPLPPSAPRSIRSRDENLEDLPAKRRNVFRRALKGLGKKSTNDLGKIEDMLVQLLGEVEGLKVAQGFQHDSAYDDYQPEGRSEPDRGYEPEGNAGTSTASHGSQSGHLSIPQSRNPSGKGFDTRKFSDHRISTVPEGDEDEEELDPDEQDILNNQFENNEVLSTPTQETHRGESVPLDTPPQQYMPSGSLSNENTPRTETEKTKKHKSSSSSGWIPKVSRWSETTASTVFRGFRSSGRNSGRKENEQFNSPPPRSDSGFGTYNNNTEHEREPEREPDHESDHEQERERDLGHYAESEPDDKLHSGFSQEQLHEAFLRDEISRDEIPAILRTPEDPKYKAHRNSLNLQHPQPRPGPTHRYQTHLESQAQNYDQPMSPSSINWGSSTSLNRLPPQQTNRYSQATTNTERNLSPISDGGYSDRSASGQAPARPPKEPIVPEKPLNIRPKPHQPSPLSNEHLVNSENNAYETGGSPRSASRKLSSALGVPTRKPTGPRSMSTASKSGELNRDDGTVIRRNKNRDTFGSISSHHSAESETF